MLAVLFPSSSPSPTPSTSIIHHAASPSSHFSLSSSGSNSRPQIRVPARKFPSESQDISPSPELNSRPNASVRMPSAPWMKGPLLLPPDEVLDLRRTRRRDESSGSGKVERTDRALTDKVGGVRGDKTVQKIVQSIERLQRTRQPAECSSSDEDEIELGLRIPFERVGGEEKSDLGGEKLPWVKEERVVLRRTKKEKVMTAAELTLDEELLARLRTDAKKMRKWVKVMKIGVSEEVVDEIHRVWRGNELAMVKFHVPLSRNMDRAQEILEMKTGGLVVWRWKDTLVIYRGLDYRSKRSSKGDGGLFGDPALDTQQLSSESARTRLLEYNGHTMEEEFRGESDQGGDVVFMDNRGSPGPVNGSLYERETDRLLEGLGPRFEDWWMRKPLPVDADLLPEVVRGFSPPLRMCPPNERPRLTDDELTYLRKLARPLPTHFVLGRNRRLQGLAAAIIKLWEKSLIAKIAVKWGVQNTSNEEMANELKHLTGGVLLLRNKFYIILFRGKDFLPSGVATSIAERDMKMKRCQLHEEDARWKASESIPLTEEPPNTSSTTGTLSDFNEIQTEHCGLGIGNKGANLKLQAERERLRKELRKQERRLFILESKMNIAEKRLLKLNFGKSPADWDPDQGMMTEEERECFRKMGLKMDDRVVLGRRGVFDGVIEALHQHWKHREVVKVITMQRSYSEVLDTANVLEAESGGILVSVDEQKEGHAMIIYRGKNYIRPSKLPTENLLTKRKALLRSLEMQRFGSLKFFARRRRQAISGLKLKLAELERQLLKDGVLHKMRHGCP